MYVDLQQFAAVLLPLESAIFYPNGNSPGNTMENSGKQNPKMGFKSPPSRRRPPKGHALKYLLRASEPRLNIMSVSPPIDSPRTIDVASCPTKACIPAS